MKTFLCQKCNHIAFDEAPVDCPVCFAPIENFENDPDAIKKPADPENLSEKELKHLPQVAAIKACSMHDDSECTNVRIKIGETSHLMDSEHFITFIDIYLDRKYISRTLFTPKSLNPSVDLHLKSSTGKLSVVGHCNVHGSWRTRVNLDAI